MAGIVSENCLQGCAKTTKRFKPSAATRHYTIVGPGFVKRLSPLASDLGSGPRSRLQGPGASKLAIRLAVRHRWDVTTAEAREIQKSLGQRWEGEDRLGTLRTVAGLDAAFVLKGSQAFNKPSHWNALRDANRAIGGVVLYSYPEMLELERASAEVALTFPYVPGFLSFREIPALLAALGKLGQVPDLLFCDGQGYAHPRRMGLASHLGVILDLPSVGCAKSLLTGQHGSVGSQRGEWSAITDGDETVGAALRTRADCAPMYISPGHRVSLDTALRLTLSVSDGTRVPRPTREADRLVSRTKRETLATAARGSHRKNQ